MQPSAFPRHFLRFMLPPLYATLLFGIYMAAATLVQGEPLEDFHLVMLVVVIYAYLFASLPSLLFAIVMARVQRRRDEPRHRLIVASIAGLIAGGLLSLVFGMGASAPLFVPLGLATGLGVEASILFCDRQERRQRRSDLPVRLHQSGLN